MHGPPQRKAASTGQVEKAVVATIATSSVGGNVDQFLELMGYRHARVWVCVCVRPCLTDFVRFDYGYRLVGLEGVALSQGFKVLVRVYRVLDLSGRPVDALHWSLELSALADARYAGAAVDAALAWSSTLAPLVELGTADVTSLNAARDALRQLRNVR